MSLLHTPLDALHRELGARMVPFAGYDMPVQFPNGIIKEHLHTRAAAGLFDVSHMGQLIIEGTDVADMLESVLPIDALDLGVDQQCYALLTNDSGGILDDLIVTRWAQDKYFLVVNAACKKQDIDYLLQHLNGQMLTELDEQALLALQGPAAREVMSAICPSAAGLTFMHGCAAQIEGVDVYITCSGYTGEDGFELSLPAASAEALARRLLSFEQVEPIGLGARDSLRLEAGLCLYGHELSAETNPVDAGLTWSISKSRRQDGERPGGFPGAETIFRRMQEGPERRRVGLRGKSKRPMREGQPVQDAQGREVGSVCSAGFGASIGGPIAMAYVEPEQAEPGTRLNVAVRDKLVPAEVVKMPFLAQRYFRG